jgi:hypothetical protein
MPAPTTAPTTTPHTSVESFQRLVNQLNAVMATASEVASLMPAIPDTSSNELGKVMDMIQHLSDTLRPNLSTRPRAGSAAESLLRLRIMHRISE